MKSEIEETKEYIELLDIETKIIRTLIKIKKIRKNLDTDNEQDAVTEMIEAFINNDIELPMCDLIEWLNKKYNFYQWLSKK